MTPIGSTSSLPTSSSSSSLASSQEPSENDKADSPMPIPTQSTLQLQLRSDETIASSRPRRSCRERALRKRSDRENEEEFILPPRPPPQRVYTLTAPPFDIHSFTKEIIVQSLPDTSFFPILISKCSQKPSFLEFVMAVASENLHNFMMVRAHRNPLAPVDLEQEFMALMKDAWIPLHIFDIVRALALGEICQKYVQTTQFAHITAEVQTAEIGLMGCSSHIAFWKPLLDAFPSTTPIVQALIQTWLLFHSDPQKTRTLQDDIRGSKEKGNVKIYKVLDTILHLSVFVKKHLLAEKAKGKLEFLREDEGGRTILELLE